jgi:glycine/sarcosine N-methyltransferase
MAEPVEQFYDELASHYHLIFEDWEASMTRQAAAIAAMLERECGSTSALRVLDCACGIGTQSLGLAKRGFHVTGCDVSPAAVQRARLEAGTRRLSVEFSVADMLRLETLRASAFDIAVCMDNALPQLVSEKELYQAAVQIRMKLRSGGLFMASIRDYDQLIKERPVVQGPFFYRDEGRRRIVHQIWDWIDDRTYSFHLYITRENAGGWETHHFVSRYSAVLRGELTGVLNRAGFSNVRWLAPPESAFYQPVVTCRT